MEDPPGRTKWYYGIAPVLIALFFVLGPLALPLLWKSPRFNLSWKIILTVLMTAITIYLIVGSWKLFLFFFDLFSRLRRQLEAG